MNCFSEAVKWPRFSEAVKRLDLVEQGRQGKLGESYCNTMGREGREENMLSLGSSQINCVWDIH